MPKSSNVQTTATPAPAAHLDFTRTDWKRIADALRIAADEYTTHAHDANDAGAPVMAKTFDARRINAISLAFLIEQEQGL
jgi:hypothetical protein